METDLAMKYAEELATLPEDQRVMVTMREAAGLIGCTYSHACELVRTGRIPRLGVNPTGHVMAATVEVLNYRDTRNPALIRKVVQS